MNKKQEKYDPSNYTGMKNIRKPKKKAKNGKK